MTPAAKSTTIWMYTSGKYARAAWRSEFKMDHAE